MLQSRFSVRTGLASLALACAAGTASGAQAATAVPVSTAPPLAIEELQELDEVVVHGTNLRDRIIRAEDRFFRLYNQLNKDDDFDVNCAYVPLEADTRIPERMCAPGFYANAIVDTLTWGERCKGSQDESGNYVPPPPCYTPPPPELVLVARSDEYARHVMQVIRSDPRLQEMAGELDEMHLQRNQLARRYVQIKSAVDAERAARPRYRPRIR